MIFVLVPALLLRLSTFLHTGTHDAFEGRTCDYNLAQGASLLAEATDLQAIVARGGWQKVYGSGKSLSSNKRLLQRLGFSTDAVISDSIVAQAIAQFQYDHGLPVTFKLDAVTLQQMNIPAAYRLRQLQSNIRRWNESEVQCDGMQIIANVAAQELDVVDDGQTILHMRTIVGRKDRKTPLFSSAITSVVIWPRWVVPPGIFQKDILPMMESDSTYLSTRGITVIRHATDSLLVQPPGFTNPMGCLKFLMPNSHYVYFHDTPDKGLFQSSTRLFSSGCVRLERARDLALLILQHDGQVCDSLPDFLCTPGETREIRLRHAVSTRLAYYTAWRGTNGRLQYARDVYNMD